MQKKILTGNAYKDRNKKQWLVGSFIESKDLRKQSGVEVMWSSHKKGDVKGRWTKSTKATTMTMLIRGAFVNSFPGLGDCVLKKEGDYIIYPPQTPHTWRALKNSVLITIRWPSPRGKHIREVSMPTDYLPVR